MPGEGAAIAGAVAGLATIVSINRWTPIAWTWYVLIGTSVTFGVGMIASLLGRGFGRRPAEARPH